MNKKYSDIKIGDRFGRLTIIFEAPKRGSHKCWNCKCDCGKITTVKGSNLKQGGTKSCGCLRREINKVKKNNKFEIVDDEVKVFIKNTFFVISKESLWILKNYTWCSRNGYISTRIEIWPKYLFLHRLIMKEELLRPENKGKVIDHINGNPLDNRLCNLRIVTISQNGINRKRRKDYGIYKTGFSWICKIQIESKMNYLGTFYEKKLAIQARDKWESEHNRLDFFRETDKDRPDYYSKILGKPSSFEEMKKVIRNEYPESSFGQIKSVYPMDKDGNEVRL